MDKIKPEVKKSVVLEVKPVIAKPIEPEVLPKKTVIEFDLPLNAKVKLLNYPQIRAGLINAYKVNLDRSVQYEVEYFNQGGIRHDLFYAKELKLI